MRKNKDAVRGKTQAQELKLLSYETPMLVQEAYKTLRTNVMLSLPGSGCKCIGLTSPTSGDGKAPRLQIWQFLLHRSINVYC